MVGPVNSGAWVESLAAGRDYYPMRAWPSSTDISVFSRFPVFESPSSLAEYLRDDRRIDRNAMMADLSEWPEISDPSATFWDTVGSGLSRDAS